MPESKITLLSCMLQRGRWRQREPIPAISGLLLSCHFTLYTRWWQRICQAERGSGPLLKNTRAHEMFYFWLRKSKMCRTILKKQKIDEVRFMSWMMVSRLEKSREMDFHSTFVSALHHHRFRCCSPMRMIVSQNSSSQSTAWTVFLRRWRQPRHCCRVRRWRVLYTQAGRKIKTIPGFNYHHDAQGQKLVCENINIFCTKLIYYHKSVFV